MRIQSPANIGTPPRTPGHLPRCCGWLLYTPICTARKRRGATPDARTTAAMARDGCWRMCAVGLFRRGFFVEDGAGVAFLRVGAERGIVAVVADGLAQLGVREGEGAVVFSFDGPCAACFRFVAQPEIVVLFKLLDEVASVAVLNGVAVRRGGQREGVGRVGDVERAVGVDGGRLAHVEVTVRRVVGCGGGHVVLATEVDHEKVAPAARDGRGLLELGWWRLCGEGFGRCGHSGARCALDDESGRQDGEKCFLRHKVYDGLDGVDVAAGRLIRERPGPFVDKIKTFGGIMRHLHPAFCRFSRAGRQAEKVSPPAAHSGRGARGLDP